MSGKHTSAANDEVGGTTLSFDLWPGHPREREARQLLANIRKQIITLWDEILEYNNQVRPPDVTYNLTFYCGQYLVEEEDST